MVYDVEKLYTFIIIGGNFWDKLWDKIYFSLFFLLCDFYFWNSIDINEKNFKVIVCKV